MRIFNKRLNGFAFCPLDVHETTTIMAQHEYNYSFNNELLIRDIDFNTKCSRPNLKDKLFLITIQLIGIHCNVQRASIIAGIPLPRWSDNVARYGDRRNSHIENAES